MWTELTANCSRCLNRQLLSKVLFIIVFTSCLLCNTKADFLDNLKAEIKKIYTDNGIQKIKESNNDALKVIQVFTGRMFKQDLNEFVGATHNGLKVTESTKKSLPSWLTFEEPKNHLIGLPLTEDLGKYKMEISFPNKTNKYFELDVVPQKEPFHCPNGLPVTTASIIFNANIKNFAGKNRVKILRKLARFVDIGVHEVVLVHGNPLNTLFDDNVLTAGPGDQLFSKEPGITLTWKVKCGTDIAGQRSINVLKSHAGNGAIKETVGLPVVGWYCSSTHKRVRRQVIPQPTPQATPTVVASVPKRVTSSIFGTPTVSPSPSVIKTSTFLPVTPTPVKSTVVVVSTKVPTPPPVTTRKTTTKAPVTTVITTEESTESPTTTMKPTVVTTETTTEGPLTTEKPPVTTRKPSPTVKPTTNSIPVLRNSIDLIKIGAQQAFKMSIPNDLFTDKEDGGQENLTLELKKMEGTGIYDDDQPWIDFDEKKKMLYLLPKESNIGKHQYIIQATDSGGLSANAVFTVDVEEENFLFTTLFKITIDTNYNKFMEKVENRVEFIYAIAENSNVKPNTIRTRRFSKGSVTVEYGCNAFSNDPCNDVEVQAYNNTIHRSEFKNALAPDYDVKATGAVSEVCLAAPGRSDFAARSAEKRWWEIVLIPVIVVSTLLLIVGLIFFFLYRQKRRYEPHREDKNTYLYHKKPVIFREEYQEKPDLVSLEPLILPNEKPPLTNPAYEPRSSTPDGDGNASSTGSTESDEKVPLTKDSPPQTPRDSPTRLPYSRSPPPYSGP